LHKRKGYNANNYAKKVIEVEGDLDCIYLTNEQCRAQPFLVDVSGGGHYKPAQEDQKAYCKNSGEFQGCPRFEAYQDHLRAIGLVKK
jgi:hypothetical protein